MINNDFSYLKTQGPIGVQEAIPEYTRKKGHKGKTRNKGKGLNKTTDSSLSALKPQSSEALHLSYIDDLMGRYGRQQQ